MPIGPIEILFCLFGLIIVPAGVAIAVMFRREDLEWPARGIAGLRAAAVAALVAVIIFILLVLIINVL
jgi:hypothetical protein